MNLSHEKEQFNVLSRIKKISRQRLSTVAITAGLFVILSVIFFVVSDLLKEYTVDFSFYILHQEAQKIKSDVYSDITFFQSDMDVLACLLHEEDDLFSEDIRQTMKAYEKKETISKLGIINIDNQLMLSDGIFVSVPSEISFERLSGQGFFLSDIKRDTSHPDSKVLYCSVPIGENGKIRGILLGIMEMDYLSSHFEANLFGEEIAISIVDTESMDMILDDLHGHREQGNILHHGHFGEDGSTNEKDRERQNIAIYMDSESDENLFSLCEPMDINNWSVLLSVPERVVLDTAQYIETILIRLGLFQGAAFIAYFIWVLFRTMREMKFKEAEINQIYYMYNVQQTLFDAYRQQENITISLEHVARSTKAKIVLLASTAGESVCRAYTWQEDSEDQEHKKRNKQLAREIAQDMLLRREAYEVSVKEKFGKEFDGLREIMGRYSIGSLGGIPIQGREGQIVGVLAVAAKEDLCNALAALTSVSYSFSMALDNIQAYETIEKMGTTDSLTDLKNRNAYEDMLKKYEADHPKRLACVYADANGLHELNNSQGHEAGDQMLKSVAAALAEAFEDGHVYRIGGDEFLVFADMEEKAAADLAREAKQKSKDQGYHVSVGVASGDAEVSVESIVKMAEQRMYEDKRQYYLGNNDRRKMR